MKKKEAKYRYVNVYYSTEDIRANDWDRPRYVGHKAYYSRKQADKCAGKNRIGVLKIKAK